MSKIKSKPRTSSKVAKKPKSAVKKVTGKSSVAKSATQKTSKISKSKAPSNKTSSNKSKKNASTAKSKKSTAKNVAKAGSRPSIAKSNSTKGPTPKSKAQRAAKKTGTKTTKAIKSKATAKKPSTQIKITIPKASKLGRDFLKSQLKKLEEERAKYATSAEQLEEEAESLLSERSGIDIQVAEESGEGDTTAYYRELDLTMSAQTREVVEQIDEAIERIKDGTYGICVDSGKPIPKKRLQAIPWASKTIEAKAGGLRRR